MEILILTWVQYFKKCGAGITPPSVIAKLIDFVEEENRVVCLYFDQRLDDNTWHGADIGSSMASDLCFISDAS